MTKYKKITQLFSIIGILLLAVFVSPRVSLAASSPDLNSDGCVNQSDYSVFAAYFQTNPKNSLGDLNSDTKVDVKDAAYIMQNWNASCVPTVSSKFRHIWQGDIGSLGDSKLTFLSQNFDIIITHLDTTASAPAPQATALTNLRTKIAQAGRTGKVKVLQYFKFAGTHTSSSDPLQAPPYAQAFVDQGLQWMSPDGTPYVDATNHWSYAALQDPAKTTSYINLIIPYLKSQLSSYPIDGFFFDNAMLLGSTETSHLVSGSYVVGRPADYNAQAIWTGKYNVISALRQDSVLAQTTILANNFWNKPYIAGSSDPNNAFQQTMNRLQFYQVADGILRERPFWQESNNFPECSDKMNITLDNLANVTSSMGDIILYAYGTDQTGRIYSAASAMVVNNGNVDYLAGPLGSNNYFPEYDLDLGLPLGAPTRPQSDLYVRDFAGGKVVVYTKANSCGTTGSTTYNIGSGYQMLSGFTGTGTFTDIGTMTWAAAPTTITLDSSHPAYILKKP